MQGAFFVFGVYTNIHAAQAAHDASQAELQKVTKRQQALWNAHVSAQARFSQNPADVFAVDELMTAIDQVQASAEGWSKVETAVKDSGQTLAKAQEKLDGIKQQAMAKARNQVKQEIAELRLSQYGVETVPPHRTIFDRMMNGVIASAKAEEKFGPGAGATSRANLPTSPNVSITRNKAGNEASPLAPMNASGIIGEGSKATANMAGDEKNFGVQMADTGITFTQGSQIPDEIMGSKPLYSPSIEKWLDGGGKFTVENGAWIYTNQQGISVIYRNGYPDFKDSGHVKQEVDIGSFNNRSTDFSRADKLAPNGPRDTLNTWHHHEDGKTLQEVNRRLHEMFTHRGGISIMKRSEK